MITAALILDAVMLWGVVGALVALVFLTIGIDRIDADARGAYAFRLLIIPGVMLLWPLVLWRWWILETGRDRRVPGAAQSASERFERSFDPVAHGRARELEGARDDAGVRGLAAMVGDKAHDALQLDLAGFGRR